MSNIKPLSNTEKVVTVGAIIGGLILFPLALTKCESGTKLFNVNSSDIEESIVNLSPTEPNTESASSEEFLVATKDIETLESKLADGKGLIASLESELEQSKKENGFLKTRLSALKSQLSGKEVSEAEANADLTDAISSSKAELENVKLALAGKNEDLAGLTAENTNLKGQLKDLTANLDELKRKITGLNTERDAIAKKLRKEAALSSEINQLSSSIKSGESTDVLKKEIAKVEAEWKKKLDAQKVQSELEKSKYTNALKSELNTLRTALRKEKTKKVFANSSDDLAPSAQRLIKSLNDYQGEKAEDLTKLYGGIKAKLKGEPKAVVQFASGSSVVSDEYKAKIKEMLSKAKANSYFVAVGYADTTGTASKNKALSSKRATKVVEALKPSLKDTQFAQAFYLGQTTRFGEPEENRVVEIWEIKE